MLDRDSKFENVDQLLEGLEQTAGRVADLFNAPPLDVAGLRREWGAFREAAAKIPPRNLPSVGFLGAHWEQLKAEAAAQNRPVFELSSMMAVSAIARVPVTLLKLARASNRAVWRSGQTLGASVLTHYSQVLQDIHERGYAAYWAQEFQPYLRAAAASVFTQAPVAYGALAEEGHSLSGVRTLARRVHTRVNAWLGVEKSLDTARTSAYATQLGSLSDSALKAIDWRSLGFAEVIALTAVAAERVLGLKMFDVQFRGALALTAARSPKCRPAKARRWPPCPPSSGSRDRAAASTC